MPLYLLVLLVATVQPLPNPQVEIHESRSAPQFDFGSVSESETFNPQPSPQDDSSRDTDRVVITEISETTHFDEGFNPSSNDRFITV